ncbi:hypothetical protein F1728_29720 [Gimesia benthica]|uniref:Calx-beta domain-containing protein n=1 Tax=Gimesia benthica TaxID=2608982 RepID=A0A6I6AQK4_9PLAN|nr:Calx-beta domain-containing protein [Gimesia benthica]QGQ26599.1 hypothetical protein F1728_29720 [Gimesia benthica]
MLLTNWLKSLTSRYRTVRSRRPRNQRSRARHRYQPALSPRPIAIEELEDRTLLTSMISIDDVSVAEGDSGTTDFVFTVTRTGNNAGDLNSSISIYYTTQDGTAKVADNDYLSESGTLQFTADASAQSQTMTVRIEVMGNTITEQNKNFQLVLSTDDPETNFEKMLGTATIINDDANSLSINDATAYEDGPLIFEVSLDEVAGADITFSASTVAGTAIESGSYGD